MKKHFISVCHPSLHYVNVTCCDNKCIEKMDVQKPLHWRVEPQVFIVSVS